MAAVGENSEVQSLGRKASNGDPIPSWGDSNQEFFPNRQVSLQKADRKQLPTLLAPHGVSHRLGDPDQGTHRVRKRADVSLFLEQEQEACGPSRAGVLGEAISSHPTLF